MSVSNENLSIKSVIKKPIVKYLTVAFLILLSNLIWYNFSKPPIYANTGFPINTFRYIRYYYLPFNFYSWPVSYNPLVNYFPGNFAYYILNTITLNNYAISFFIYNVGFEIAGGFSLFYLTSRFFHKYNISELYAFVSVLIYAFNASLFLDGGLFESGTSELLIILLLLYLIVYKSKIYLFLLGFLSFFIFFPFPGGYPDGATILLEEFVIIIVLIILKEGLTKIKNNCQTIFPLIISILLSIGIIAISLSYLLFIIYASGSTLIGNSVSLKPAYVFGFIYDWIAVLPNAMRLILNWGVYTAYAAPWVSSYLANPIILSLLYILPFFSLSSIIFLKRSDYYLYASLVISILAATTANPPLGNLFIYIMLHVGPLRVFYESDAYYPILVIFYSLLFPFSLYNFSELLRRYALQRRISKRKIKPFILNKRTHKVFVFALILIVLATAFPLYTGLVDESSSAMPVESSIPSYYFSASNFLQSHGHYSPVMVLPGIYGFSSYETSEHIWYQGIDLYPTLINNPSISDDISGSYTVGRGDAYSVISYVYGRPITNAYYAYQNDSGLYSSTNFITTNGSIIKWITNYPTDQINFESNSSYLNDYINGSTHNNKIGSHDLLGYFNHSINLSRYDYVTLDIKTSVPTSSFSIGFMNSSGDFVYYVGMNNFLPTITPNTPSEVPVYLGSADHVLARQNITAIVISYNHRTGNPNDFNLSLYSLKFMKSSVNYADILARGMNILGVKYAYVDTGIVDSYGQFNGNGYNSVLENSSLYNLDFRQGTVSIYSYRSYDGLISSYSKIVDYRNESYLLGNLFYNISSNDMPLYGLNIKNITETSGSQITNYEEISPTDYIVNISYKGPVAVFFKEGYSPNWIAVNSNGSAINTHFEADGYGNGWLISNNTSKIEIIYSGAQVYAGLVTITVAIPFLMLSVFILLYSRRRLKVRRRL